MARKVGKPIHRSARASTALPDRPTQQQHPRAQPHLVTVRRATSAMRRDRVRIRAAAFFPARPDTDRCCLAERGKQLGVAGAAERRRACAIVGERMVSSPQWTVSLSSASVSACAPTANATAIITSFIIMLLLLGRQLVFFLISVSV